jgi:16S rRNA (guanine1207-N2)-methyltransferase
MVDNLEHYFTNNANLKSELRNIGYEYQNNVFSFTSDNGVFSKSEIDYGSQLLVETILKNTNKVNLNILDVGCGYGFIGIVLAKLLDANLTMVDVNNRAIHLAQMNIKNNKVNANAFYSDAYESVTGNYDLIVTNPPIRAGKEVVYKILQGAADHLKDDGMLWMVIRKNQGAKSAIRDLENTYFLNIVAKSKGFYVIKAEKR